MAAFSFGTRLLLRRSRREICRPLRSNHAASPRQDAADDVHLIVAEDAEVVIEHYPEDWIAFVIFWSLAFIVFLQFFTRYILNDSLAWTEEIARYGLMWVVFIGGAMVTRRSTHIAVELLVERYEARADAADPPRRCRYHQTSAFIAFLAYISVTITERMGHPAHDGVRPVDGLGLRRRFSSAAS